MRWSTATGRARQQPPRRCSTDRSLTPTFALAAYVRRMRTLVALVALVTLTAWTWEHPAPTGAAVHAVSGRGVTAYAVGARGTIHHTQNTRGTWRPIASGTVADLNGTAMLGSVVFA